MSNEKADATRPVTGRISPALLAEASSIGTAATVLLGDVRSLRARADAAEDALVAELQELGVDLGTLDGENVFAEALFVVFGDDHLGMISDAAIA